MSSVTTFNPREIRCGAPAYANLAILTKSSNCHGLVTKVPQEPPKLRGMAILSKLRQWDSRLVKQLFQQGKRRHSLIQLSRIVSRSGEGYLQVVFPITAWSLASPAASAYVATLTLAFTIERAIYLIFKTGSSVGGRRTS